MTSHLNLQGGTKQLRQQVWRYFTSIFLCSDINSLIILVIYLFFFVSLFQRFMGNMCVAIAFFGSNIVFNFFLISCFKGNQSYSFNLLVEDYMGGFAGLFGIFGAALAYLIINYSRMESIPSLRYMFSCQLIFVIVLGNTT